MNHDLLLRGLRRVPVAALTLLLVLLPLAGALVAVAYAPPAHVEIAGQPVSLRPVIGQDTSRLADGAIVRPEHAEVLGKDIGVDIDANWNRLIPSNKRTRGYLVALWNDPNPQLARIREASRSHVIFWALAGFGAGAATSILLWWMLRSRRRKLASYPPAGARLVRAHNRRLRRLTAAVGVVALVGVHVLAVRILLRDDHHTVRSSPTLLGTTLEGTEVNGLIGDILPLLSVLRPRTGFYDTVADNLTTAVAGEPGLEKTEGEVTFVLAEDFEDVDGMARQVGLAADLVDADFIALSGDLTFAGKPVESYIIDTVDYYSGKKPVYLAPGPHDTEAIVRAAKARGWHVGDGRTRDVEGLTLLSAPDPRISTVGNFGTVDVLRNPDTFVETFVSDTIAEACDSHPDFVLLHDHALGEQIAAAGCQGQAVLDGRSYEFLGPRRVPTESGPPATEFTSGSAGGHVSTDPDPGVIKHPARFTVMKFDPDADRTRYFVVTVEPDASVTVAPGVGLGVPRNASVAGGG